MLESVMGRKLFSLAESSHLRIEAMQLFEQCLTNGDSSALVGFIERQLVHEPPRLQLLREIAEDLQQRLLSLREYHFDVRERVVTALSESYDVDITPLTPSALLEQYHHLTPDEILAFVQKNNPSLGSEDVTILRKMVDASLHMAAQLYYDIQLTRELFNLIVDWTEALNATIARQHWYNHPSAQPDPNEGDIYH